MTGVFLRKDHAETHTVERGVMMRWLLGRCTYEPRNPHIARSPQTLEEAGKNPSSELSEGA